MCDVTHPAVEVIRSLVASHSRGRRAAHTPLDPAKTIRQNPALPNPNAFQECLEGSHILVRDEGTHT